EDYQQIMIYLVMKKSWDCDPGGITDKWDDKTHEATNKFIANYNDWLLKQKPPPKDAAILDPELSGQIKKDSKHRWPIEMWRAVFDLYTEALVNALNSDSELFEKDYRPLLKFAVDEGREYKYVACGESFPIDQALKSNYRSQSNRRVEFLFFDEKEVPHFDCPDRVKTVHTIGECPIWNKLHFNPVYINPEDIALEQIDLAFETVNIKTDQLLYIPDGLKIKVIEDGAKEIYSRITYTRSFYTIKIRKNPARTSLDLGFETKDQWVDCSDPNAPKIVTKTLEEMAQMHFDERSKFYDLPEKWHSKNWMVKRGGNWVKFSDTIMNRSGGVITVNLDTTVLVNGSMNPETVTSSDRFTIFTHKLKIINSDSDRGFLTSGTVDKNLFDKILMGWRPRLFAWNSNFYDCTLKRLYTGDYIGVRAAVKCDPDDHSTASIVEPVVSGAGNFDLHYLKDCLDPDGKGIDGLLVHWVCKFTLDTGVNANHVANFDTQGFNNAITRWQAKKYHFIPDADPQNRKLVVWPFFFFEHRDANPHKCNVTLHLADGGRSDMGITNGNFKTPDYCGHGASVSEDSVTYARFTMAHEIGHAMGLDDEYRESLEVDNSDRITWWNPPLPRFQQWYPGMPYCIDNRAMMVSNKAPRLRHFWYWCRWVNETTDVKRLTGNSVFHVENGLGKSYKFFIKDAMNNIYKSVVNEENKHNGSSGIFDLYLYKCGADETTDLMITGKSDFDSTLVVRIKLQWFFDDY
ncbi:MAG TPA: hypothetical protein DCZ43_08360, partial [candidate division Zixibacteria bacterium]|nr:hypothetical protein [candidate division Zixibacteria bacterium]